MWDRPRLPLLLQLSAVGGTALYLWLVAGDIPSAVIYGIVDPVIIAVFGLIALHDRRVGSKWFARALWFSLPIILLNIPGTLYLHDLELQYDRFLHVAVAFFSLLFASSVLVLWRHGLKTAVILTFIGLFVFEGYQWSSDRLIGTRMFTDNQQSLPRDVTEDILFGSLGMLLAIPVARRYRARNGRQ